MKGKATRFSKAREGDTESADVKMRNKFLKMKRIKRNEHKRKN